MSRDVIQIQCGLVAVPMASYFECRKKITRHSHNNPLSFRQVYTSADYYRCSVYPKTIALWNKLPTEAVLLTYLDYFKRELKKINYLMPYKATLFYPTFNPILYQSNYIIFFNPLCHYFNFHLKVFSFILSHASLPIILRNEGAAVYKDRICVSLLLNRDVHSEFKQSDMSMSALLPQMYKTCGISLLPDLLTEYRCQAGQCCF